MAIRSGLAAQLGIQTEETVGTYKKPTTFLPFESESLALTKNFIESKGLRAGQTFQAQGLHRGSSRTVAGDFTMEFLTTGMGKILNLLHGNTVTPEKAETKTYTQKHELKTGKDPYGKSLTVQVGRPDIAGTVQPFSYIGCKVMGLTLAVDSGGTMMMTVSVVGMDEKVGEGLETASYAATYEPFTFEGMELKWEGTKLANARSATFNIAIAQATDRMNLGSSGTILEPIVNDFATCDVSMTLEFANLAAHERYTKETVKEILLTGKGTTKIEGTSYPEVKIKIPAAKQVDSSPVVAGPDILMQDVTFKTLDNGTNPPVSIETVSEDSAL